MNPIMLTCENCKETNLIPIISRNNPDCSELYCPKCHKSRIMTIEERRALG